MVDELKHKFEARRKYLEEKFKNAQQTKNDLLRQIDIIYEEIKLLKLTRSEDEASESLRQLEGQDQIARIYRQEFSNERAKDMTGIEMLKEMEKKIEGLVRELKQLRALAPKFLEQKEKEQKNAQRDQNKLQKKDQDSKEFQQKMIQKQQQSVKTKRSGRPMMVRSWPPVEEVEEQKIEEIPQEEIERIRYFT